jgi:hypothetical protein
MENARSGKAFLLLSDIVRYRLHAVLRNGIQEVARSIRVSSTNKIKRSVERVLGCCAALARKARQLRPLKGSIHCPASSPLLSLGQSDYLAIGTVYAGSVLKGDSG